MILVVFPNLNGSTTQCFTGAAPLPHTFTPSTSLPHKAHNLCVGNRNNLPVLPAGEQPRKPVWCWENPYSKVKIILRNVQWINVVQEPRSLIQRVKISNMMDYSPQGCLQVMNGKLQNPPLNERLPLAAQTHRQSQGCHNSDYKSQEAIKVSLTLAILEVFRLKDVVSL